MNNLFLILIFVVAILEITGDILFKEWVIQDKNIFIILGVIFYMIATVVWAFSLKFQSLSKAVVIFAVITLIAGVIVGVFVYKEQLNNIHILGIVLGLISIALLES